MNTKTERRNFQREPNAYNRSDRAYDYERPDRYDYLEDDDEDGYDNNEDNDFRGTYEDDDYEDDSRSFEDDYAGSDEEEEEEYIGRDGRNRRGEYDIINRNDVRDIGRRGSDPYGGGRSYERDGSRGFSENYRPYGHSRRSEGGRLTGSYSSRDVNDYADIESGRDDYEYRHNYSDNDRDYQEY